MSKQLPKFNEIKDNEKSFFEIVNLLFETAPPLAQKLSEVRFNLNSFEELIDTADTLIKKMSHEDRLQVINAHPRIGLDPSSAISALSYKEQGIDKDKLIDTEKLKKIYSRLRELNEQYEKKNGFRFVVFVNGRTKEQLIPVFESRLKNTPENELELGLSEMLAIAHDRLKKISTSTSNL